MTLSGHRWLVAALTAILAGYLLLGLLRQEVLGPLLLVGGYCILLPLYLWVRHRADRELGE